MTQTSDSDSSHAHTHTFEEGDQVLKDTERRLELGDAPEHDKDTSEEVWMRKNKRRSSWLSP